MHSSVTCHMPANHTKSARWFVGKLSSKHVDNEVAVVFLTNRHFTQHSYSRRRQNEFCAFSNDIKRPPARDTSLTVVTASSVIVDVVGRRRSHVRCRRWCISLCSMATQCPRRCRWLRLRCRLRVPVRHRGMSLQSCRMSATKVQSGLYLQGPPMDFWP